MPRILLTDLAVRALKPTGLQQTYWCSQTPNFGVRVSQRGSKSFVVMLGRKRRRKCLGAYPDTSVQDARREAKKLLVEVETRAEPERASLSMHDGCTLFFETYVRPNYRPRNARLVEDMIIRDTRRLRHRTLREITTGDLTKIFDQKVSTPTTANNLFGVLRTFFRWCERRQLIDRSPLYGLPLPYKKRERERTLNDNEFRSIYRTAASMQGSFAIIVKLLMLTGQRRGEITGLRWDDIAEGSMTFPLTKNGRSHTIPVLPLASETIALVPRVHHRLLFPGRDVDEPFCGWFQAKTAFDKRCGIAGWTLHDLRRTYSTIQARIGTPPHITERILNHQVGTLTPIAKIYNRYSYFNEMRDAMLNYEHQVLRILSVEKQSEHMYVHASPGLTGQHRDAP